MYKYSYFKHALQFNFNARTSRGEIKTHYCYIIKVSDSKDDTIFGLGEASPLIGLSIDATDNFEDSLKEIINQLNQGVPIDLLNLQLFPSVNFALETAILDLKNGGNRVLYHNGFVLGEPIAINGLIWMDSPSSMFSQVIKKVETGFNCIKLKIGALDFDEEVRLIEKIRKLFGTYNLEIRVDANGAFLFEDTLEKIKILSRFNLHSIEQPIKPGNAEMMQEICVKSKIKIALDEELIGVDIANAFKLLQTIKPHFVIIKPTLIGGTNMADFWINQVQKLNIGWWATSALESNIGLNTIAQWVFSKNNKLHQGLGTGNLYDNNFTAPLTVNHGMLSYSQNLIWQNFKF